MEGFSFPPCVKDHDYGYNINTIRKEEYMKRKVENSTQGFETRDGAGVRLVRVLGNNTTDIYDPILMLDSFDTDNYEDYKGGFPEHPHRGIETISYIKHGRMRHSDSIGFSDEITDGQVQWMTAGSGILHEEVLPESDRLLGVQLWLNLSQADKMVKPHYQALKDLPRVEKDDFNVDIISGSYDGVDGFKAPYHPLTYYAVEFKKDGKFNLDVNDDNVVILFTLLGDIDVEGDIVKEKTAATLTGGDEVEFSAKEGSVVLVLISKRLDEKIAWGGPIVMNTMDEIYKAFAELREGTFIKEKTDNDD